MTSVLKQVAGIDVAQNELVVSLGRIGSSLEKDIYACKSFANKESGFKAMLVWVSKHTVNTTGVRYVMEATVERSHAQRTYRAVQQSGKRS